jgi:hypothetical protein
MLEEPPFEKMWMRRGGEEDTTGVWKAERMTEAATVMAGPI